MAKPPQIFPVNSIIQWVGEVPSFVWIIVGAVVALYSLYRFIYRALGVMATVGAIILLGASGFSVVKLHKVIASWQTTSLHPVGHAAPHTTSPSGIVNPLTSGGTNSAFNLNAMNPLSHENPWVVAIAIIAIALIGLVYLIHRGMSPTKRAEMMTRLRSASTKYSPKHTDTSGQFPLVGIEVGVRKDNGKPISIDGKDRFINTLVLGSIGTGKTSRILTKGVYQDIRSIADGNPMDVIVLDPDGGFAQSAVNLAQKLGVHTEIMDLRGTLTNTVSFNPFTGGDIADIIDNVRAALAEKMGRQEGFFQNAQDDLVRTVIQVQVPLWPDTDFTQFAELVTDPLHFRAVCSMVHDCATQPTAQAAPKGKKKRPEERADEITAMWEHERPMIEALFAAMNPAHRSMVLSAARSFLMNTRSEQRMERFETITQGLKLVVNEFVTNPRLKQVLSSNSLPSFEFQSFFASGPEVKGRLIAVVTGNRPVGKLFGKLFLVTLKMYSLERGGTEATRRPVYLYVDEFPVFGTESFTEMLSQARKYRVGMTLAIQARAQLLDVSKKFMDVVEGSCRNKIFFPAPSPDDARFLEHALGTKQNIRETYSENKLNWLFLDNRNLDRRVSTQETIDPRYRLEDIAYGLSKDEAIFAMTQDNQVMRPCVGITSFADEWVRQRRGFFHVNATTAGSKPPKQPKRTPLPHVAEEPVQETPSSPQFDVIEEITANQTPDIPVLIAATSEPESLSEATEPLTSYVRPKADPNVSIPIGNLVWPPGQPIDVETRRVAPPEGGSDRREISDTHDKPVAQQSEVRRVNLRKRNSTESTNVAATETKKLCPNCQYDLEVTEDERKWHCSQCGFERRNR